MNSITIRIAAAVALTGVVLSSVVRADATPSVRLADGDRVAILGDSITEQKNYSAMIELYLLACQPAANLQATQFGWGGETTWGFAPRMQQDVLWFKPTVATLAYGMNDGGYGPVNPGRLADYKKSTKAIIDQLKASGTRLIVVGGPGVVDRDAFDRAASPPGAHAKLYNQTLATFNDAARDVANQEGVTFADLNTVMADAMATFKKLHPDRSFVGGDGIHPDNVGHAVMAYAFLKAMGCDGDIGTLTVDLDKHQAEATAGHKVLSMDANTLTLESTRYPFNVQRNGDPTGIAAAMDVVPFQETLNRFRLIVNNVPAGKRVKITWTEVPTAPSSAPFFKPTEVSKTFDAAALASGINLAASFDTTPFEHAFARLDSNVHAQQDFETSLTKRWLHNQKEMTTLAPAAADKLEKLSANGKAFDDDLRAVSAAMVVPVKHTIRFDIE